MSAVNTESGVTSHSGDQSEVVKNVGKSTEEGKVAVEAGTAQAQAFQIWLLEMQAQNAVFTAFKDYMKSLNGDVKTSGRA